MLDSVLDGLKEWILNICTAIFFTTAIEMILPSNSMKKYAKFILGLILIVVMVNPIVKLFDDQYNMNNYIDTASRYFEGKEYEKDYEKYKSSSINNTADVFSKNLENLCVQKLEKKYPKDNYEVSVKVQYNEKEEKFIINEVDVGINEGNIKEVQKVDIHNNSKEVSRQESVSREKSKDIIKYISDTFDISKEKIKLYKK